MSVVRVIWRIGICVKSSLLVNGPQNNVRHGGECLNVLPNEESDTKKEGNTMHVLSRGHCMYRMYVKARTSSINKVSPALFLRSANNQLWHATFTFLCARLPDGGTRCSKIVPYRGLARIARKCPGASQKNTYDGTSTGKSKARGEDKRGEDCVFVFSTYKLYCDLTVGHVLVYYFNLVPRVRYGTKDVTSTCGVMSEDRPGG